MATMLSTSEWTTFQVRSGSSSTYAGVQIIIISQDPVSRQSVIRVRPYLLKTSGSGAYQYNDKTTNFTFDGSSQSITTDYDLSQAPGNNVKCFLQDVVPYRRVSGAGTKYSNVPIGNEGTYYGLNYIINHDPDGTATNIEFTITWKLDNTASVKDVTQTGTFDLPTVPVASVLDPVTPFFIDDTISLSYTQYVDTYKEKLTISSGGVTIRAATAVTNPVSITLSQTEKDALLALATSPQIPITFTLTTYTNTTYTTQVGIPSEVDSYVTTLSSVILDSYNAIRDGSGNVTGYHYGINGIVDTTLLAGLQVFGALYLNGGRIYAEHVLYNNTTGTTGDVPLSDNPTNYEYIEIFGKDSYNRFGSVAKVYHPTIGMLIDTMQLEASSSASYFRRARYTVAENELTVANQGWSRILASSAGTSATASQFFVVRVVGYK